MTLAEQEPEKDPVSEAAAMPVVSEADRIGAPPQSDDAPPEGQPDAPPTQPVAPPSPSTGDEPTVFMPAAPKRDVPPVSAEPRFPGPPVPPLAAPPHVAAAVAPPLAAPTPPAAPISAPAVTPPTAPPGGPFGWPSAASRTYSAPPTDPADEPTMIISPVLSNRPSMIGSAAPAVMPAAPMAPTASDHTAPAFLGPMAPAPAATRPTMPPPPPFISPPPPPPPSQPPRLPFGDVGPGSRKPLVARKRLREQLHPIASEIQPGESGRRKRLLRSRAARSSVVVVFDGLMSLAAVAAAALGITAIAGRQEFELPGPLVAAKVVEVPAKRSLDDIGDTLERAGVVSDSTTFVWGARIAQIADLKAGEYEFKAHATMRDVAEELQQGKVIQHKITFPEGWTSEQVVQRLLDETRLAGKIAAIPEEGSLLPETYLFPKGDNREHVLDQMRRAQDRRLTEIWAHRNADALKMLKVPRDLVILASIVEKETGKADERARVAGVFVNRLNRGMRLETDPTILYGLYGGKAWLEPRVISKADLAAPNPYNTYKINGLPPGPIGNPGRAAMEAVANPAVSNELFFVADGSGGHLFSETVEEHNKNVARWREIEKQRHAGDPNAPMNPSGIGILNLTPTPAASTPAAATTKPTSQRPAAQKRLRGAVQPRPDSPANPN